MVKNNGTKVNTREYTEYTDEIYWLLAIYLAENS